MNIAEIVANLNRTAEGENKISELSDVALSQLKSFKVKIDAHLDDYLSLKAAEAEKVTPEAKELIDHVKDLTVRGGKRIRAALLYYSYLAHGGRDKEEALKASMGMEMSETYLLTHDDIIDDDDLRRGGITIHADYEKICREKFGEKISPKHLGQSIAILAGDVACAYSNEIIAQAKFKDQYKVRALAELNKIYEREVFGETLDVLIEVKENPTKEDVLLIQQLKTAPYTFDSPMKLGAILAGANEHQIKSLETYTEPLGTAFQIQDDILGMFGSEDKTGKPIISDLREGKITLLILDALKDADKDQAEIIKKNLGNKKITHADLEEVKKVMINTGALKKSTQLAVRLATKSHDALLKMRLKKEGKDFLLGIAEYIVKREY
jgi:geranylgeranyl diphosphate synthase type I